MPEIIWRGASDANHFWGRDGKVPIAIVNHIIAGPGVGSIEAADSWFKNPAAEASTHFGVAKDGRIWQWVSVQNAAFANGDVTTYDASIPWLVQAIKNGVNVNYLTVGIEHEGQPGDGLSETQYQASLWLQTKLVREWGIKISRQTIIGHYQIDGEGRKNCPGSKFPWQRLINDLLASSSGAFPPPIVIPPATATPDFKSNGFWVRGEVARFYRANGGISAIGLALDEAHKDAGYTAYDAVQNFERARFEIKSGKVVARGLVNSERLGLASKVATLEAELAKALQQSGVNSQPKPQEGMGGSL